jgi:hypothetical protein
MKSLRISQLAFLIALVIALVLCTLEKVPTKKQEISNLSAFTKLYGYIKYFHPSDQASQIDWQKFAIYGAKIVKDAKNNQELKAIFEELFLPIAPTIQIYNSHEKPKKFNPTRPENVEGLHFVAWQHRGVGLNPKQSMYQSVRLGRHDIPERIQDEIWLNFTDLKCEGKRCHL